MDFLSALPRVGEMGSILVVVYRFSKYGIFIPAPRNCTAEEVLILKMEVLGNTAVNREQSGWTIYGFWTEVFRLLGSKLNFSTSLHPQHRWAD